MAARLWLGQGDSFALSSPFSNGRISMHYNPKDKIYVCFVGNAYKCVYICVSREDVGMNRKEWQGDLLVS